MRSDVDGDMQITIDALREAGVDARAVAWDDESFDWSFTESSCHVVVARSTWDYHRRIDGFLDWVDEVSRMTRLENPADVLRWNVDKRYLAELGSAGLPVIETVFVEPGDSGARWSEVLETWLGKGDVVVKPAISAGSNDTLRHGDATSARAHIENLLSGGRVVMVQPYLDRVDTESETGLVYIDGEFSHAFSKGPMLASPADAVGGLYLAERIDARSATGEQRDLGDRVMKWLEQKWGRLLYARIDLLPTDQGPVIIEVELTEPSLYLHLDEGAPARLAAAIVRRLS